jgi:ligand-binding SRPBCC domain-containing protein
MASSFALITRTSVPVEQMFDVSLSIDEHVASMDRSGEQAIAGVTGGSIGLGETVTWRARHFGIWFTMTSRITSLDRPEWFVDEQVRGPFRSFHHEHTFTRDGETTVMIDTLTIGSPIFGRLAERVVLVPYLRRLIRLRNRHLLATVDAAPGTDPQLPT